MPVNVSSIRISKAVNPTEYMEMESVQQPFLFARMFLLKLPGHLVDYI